MSLSQQIQTDYLTAYKAKDALRLSVLRHLKTAATNLSVELKRDVNDDELLDVVLKQAKHPFFLWSCTFCFPLTTLFKIWLKKIIPDRFS